LIQALHPTEQTNKQSNFRYYASTDCFPLQNLMQAPQHGGRTALNTFL